jgi:LAO/AO transport system kinase
MARATLDSADILDVAGFRYILVETVGVGQDEVEIASASHTTVVVSAPGLGDEIQAIKAGILEIADVHVVSKSDRADARSTVSDLKQMLALGLAAESSAAWRPPVIATSSIKGEGFEELVSALGRHKAFLEASNAGAARARKIAEFRMLKTAEELLRRRFKESSAGRVAAMAERLVAREISPYVAGEQLLDGTGG